MADVLCPLQAIGLADKTAFPAPVRQLHLAQTQGGRNTGEEGAQLGAWQFPDFHGDAYASFGDPHHAGAERRAAGQGIQLVVR